VDDDGGVDGPPFPPGRPGFVDVPGLGVVPLEVEGGVDGPVLLPGPLTDPGGRWVPPGVGEEV
jgi:hypothetical protein